MILLRTLGAVQLEGGPLSLAGRRRELALAAFLARRAPRPCQRTELASLLWESRDEARARQSLRQALLELKRHCAERVPRHMIVDTANFLEELPRTRNGKVDRLALQRMTTEEVAR